MNHAASNVLFILAQNASARRGFGKNQAKPIGKRHFDSRRFVFCPRRGVQAIDTNRFCA